MGSPQSDRLLAGKTLMDGQFIISPNGRYKFINENGGMTLYDGTTTLWTTGERLSVEHYTPRFTMRDDDMLLFDDASRGPWGWNTDTRRRISGGSAELVIRDSGDVVCLSEGLTIWATKPELIQSTPPKYEPIDPKADRIKLFQYLPVNQPLNSPNGQYSTILQPDGNLVLRRNTSNTIIWSLGTKAQSSPATEFRMQYDCKLVILAADGSQIWSGSDSMIESINTLIAYDNGLLEVEQQEYAGGLPNLWTNNLRLPVGNEPVPSLNAKESLAIDQKLTRDIWELGFTTNGHITIRNTTTNETTYYYTHLRPNVEGATLMTVTWSQHIEFRDAHNRVLSRTKRVDSLSIGNVKFSLYSNRAYLINDAWTTINNQWKGTTPTPPPSIHGSKLLPGQSLSPNEALVSGDGNYYMIYQDDGNLVIYDRQNKVKWAADCGWKDEKLEPGTVAFHEDGNLIVSWKNGTQSYTSNSGVGGGDAVFCLQNDGNAVVYVDEQPFWASNDQRRR